MLVGIAVRKSDKARCSVSLPVHREDEGELIDRVWELQMPERVRKLEGSERRGAAWLDLIIEDQKAGQVVPGHVLSLQEAVPAGRLYRTSRDVDGFGHSATRERNKSELRLPGVVHAVMTERLGQSQRLFGEGLRSLHILGIPADASGDLERSCESLRAATPAQD